MAATSSSSTIKLHCRHCGGEIESNTRKVQCVHCGALFPFSCLVCGRNLRPPFPIFDDERFLTFNSTNEQTGAITEAKPLCQDHFLRHCPDCGRWFHAQENSGFFRCAQCAAEKEKLTALQEVAFAEEEPEIIDHEELISIAELDSQGRRPLDSNKIAIASGVGALFGLICWYLLNL